MKVKDLFDVLIGTEDVRIFTAGCSSIWEGEEVRIIDYDNMVVYRGCAFTIPDEYYQREIKKRFLV